MAEEKKPERFVSEQFKEIEEEKKEKKAAEIIWEKEKIQKKQKAKIKSEKNLFIITGIIVLFFIVFILGYRFFFSEKPLTIDELHNLNLAGELDEEKGYLYNGFSFVKVNNMWFTRFKRATTEQPYNVQLRFAPKDIEDVSLEGDYLYLLNFNSTYVTFDPLGQDLSHVALAAADISSNLAAILSRSAIAACTKNETPACKTRPIINCSSGFPTILIKEDSETRIEASGTCITIQGQGMELVKAADRLLLAWYGIMP